MNGKTIQDTYKKLTQLEHILKRPDSYIGSIDRQQKTCWVWDQTRRKLEYRQISFVPGLYKIFDEILVNAADNYQRDKSMTYIRVEIDPSVPYIAVENDGMGIPVQIHRDAGIYVAEMIFGELLTSSNYDDTEAKVVGGRNGYGAKLTNIYSKNFRIVTADRKKGKLLRKRWYNNMRECDEVEIEGYEGSKNFTRVEFEPDLKAFKMSSFDEDITGLISRRVLDIAGVSPGYVGVSLNGRKLPVHNFEEYFKLFTAELRKLERNGGDDSDDEVEDDQESKAPVVAHLKLNRWEVIASVTRSGSFHQVSFVNGISTLRGGTHVDYISEQIVAHALELAQKKAKKIRMSPSQVKGHLIIFVNCLIENPTFDSQTKQTLTLKKEKFGSTCELTKPFMKVLVEKGLVDMVVELAKFKEMRAMENKLNKGKKRGQLIVDKLEDANEAGGKKASQCTLILTEGDSAKALAMAGLEIVGRDLFGVYPLRGKMLNVRDASLQSIKDNKEIKELTDILGLQIGKTYHSKEERSALRYGHVMIMADQDQDGSHIKGLVINFISYFWPSLIHGNFFLRQFITPLLKAFPNRAGRNTANAIPFFTIQEYHKWSRETSNSKSFKIKYYKGLGTSTSDEGRDYFSELATHIIAFRRDGPPDDSAIQMAFKKDKVADRKRWLDAYDEETYLQFDKVRDEPYDFMSRRAQQEYTPKLAVSFNDFVHKELIHFSMADTVRSIPSMCDGLKPGQRKIMFACFKRKMTSTSEVKVAQLAGYVAEHTEYHHGQQSLKSTIIGLAQDFVGSNNLNLLLPVGQFGTRNMGGKDHASARYIFTSLNKLTRILFHPDDDRLFKYKIEDGHRVEPNYYLPILPTVLINGSDGIGTGWSSTTPRFSPRELAEAFLMRLDGSRFRPLQPWYRGWIGEMREFDPSTRKLKGNKKKKDGEKAKNQSIMSYLDSEGRGMDEELKELDALIQEEDYKYEPEIVTHTQDRRYLMQGILERDIEDPERKILIKELPIRKWTKDYKHFLMLLLESNHQIARENKRAQQEKKVKKQKEVKKPAGKGKKEKEGGEIPAGLEDFQIQDLREYHTEKRVHFMIVLTYESWKKISEISDVALKEKLKLMGSISLTNMVLFSPEGKLKHYHSVEEVCQDFYKLRLQKYKERHEMLLRRLKKESFIKSEKARFIREVNEEVIKINKKKSKIVKQILASRNFKPMEEIDRMFRGPEDQRQQQAKLEIAIEEKEGGQQEEEEGKQIESGGQNYGYLLNMPIVSMTEERARALEEEKLKLLEQVAEMESISSEDLWRRDIHYFLEELDVYEEELDERERIANQKGKRNKRNQGGGIKRKQSKLRTAKKPQPKLKEENLHNKPALKPYQPTVKVEAPKWVETKKPEKLKAQEIEKFHSIFETIKSVDPPERKREQVKKQKIEAPKKNAPLLDTFFFRPQERQITAKEESQVKQNIQNIFGRQRKEKNGVIDDSSDDALDL